jgi:hypothetical protein
MRIEPVYLPDIPGPLVIKANWLTGSTSLLFDGQPVPRRSRNRFLVPTRNGNVTEIVVHRRFTDPQPLINHRGETYRIGPPLPAVIKALWLLPLGLAIIGGLLGGAVGGVGVLANAAIIRTVQSTAAKAALMIGVLLLAFLGWLVLVALVQLAFV